MTTVTYSIDPVNGTDSPGSALYKTVTYATQDVGQRPRSPGEAALLQVVPNTPVNESIIIAPHYWSVLPTNQMVIDFGGNNISSPTQNNITVGGCPSPWRLQNGNIVVNAGWGIECDNYSVVWLGENISLQFPTSGIVAGGILANAKSQIVCYGSLMVSGNAGALLQGSIDSMVLYEPAAIVLSGPVNINVLFLSLLSGKVCLSSHVTFKGTYTFTGIVHAEDAYSAGGFIAPNGLTGP